MDEQVKEMLSEMLGAVTYEPTIFPDDHVQITDLKVGDKLTRKEGYDGNQKCAKVGEIVTVASVDVPRISHAIGESIIREDFTVVFKVKNSFVEFGFNSAEFKRVEG